MHWDKNRCVNEPPTHTEHLNDNACKYIAHWHVHHFSTLRSNISRTSTIRHIHKLSSALWTKNANTAMHLNTRANRPISATCLEKLYCQHWNRRQNHWKHYWLEPHLNQNCFCVKFINLILASRLHHLEQQKSSKMRLVAILNQYIYNTTYVCSTAKRSVGSVSLWKIA